VTITLNIIQSTPFITPNKCAVLTNTNIKDASTACFGTSARTLGRTNCHFKI